jgi:hypothetical protein
MKILLPLATTLNAFSVGDDREAFNARPVCGGLDVVLAERLASRVQSSESEDQS